MGPGKKRAVLRACHAVAHYLQTIPRSAEGTLRRFGGRDFWTRELFDRRALSHEHDQQRQFNAGIGTGSLLGIGLSAYDCHSAVTSRPFVCSEFWRRQTCLARTTSRQSNR